MNSSLLIKLIPSRQEGDVHQCTERAAGSRQTGTRILRGKLLRGWKRGNCCFQHIPNHAGNHVWAVISWISGNIRTTSLTIHQKNRTNRRRLQTETLYLALPTSKRNLCQWRVMKYVTKPTRKKKTSNAPSMGFPKWWYPTTIGVPTKNDYFGVFWGYHHFRKHPCLQKPGKKQAQGSSARASNTPHLWMPNLWHGFEFGSIWRSDHRGYRQFQLISACLFVCLFVWLVVCLFIWANS